MSDQVLVRRGDVVIVGFRDASGAEIRKRRPYVVVSPDEQNSMASTYILAPLTTGHHPYHSRVPCKFAGRNGHVVLDQIRSTYAARASHPVGQLSAANLRAVLERLREMFAE